MNSSDSNSCKPSQKRSLNPGHREIHMISFFSPQTCFSVYVTLKLSKFVTVIGDPAAAPRVSGKKEAWMCSVKGICPEQQRSQYTPQLQAAPWEPGLDGSCFPGDLDSQDLLSNYLRPPKSASRKPQFKTLSTETTNISLISWCHFVLTEPMEERCIKAKGQQPRTWKLERKRHKRSGYNAGVIIELR